MNLEEELARTMSIAESGIPMLLRDGRAEAEPSDIAAPMPMPEPGAVTPGAPTDGFKPMQLPASPFPGQPAASVALGVPGEAGAAATIQPTEPEKVMSGAMTGAAQEVLNLGAEAIDYIGGLLGKDPQALEAVRNVLPNITPDTETGKAIKTIGQFALTFALLRGMGAGNVAAGVGADVLQNPEEGNLSTLAVQLGFAPELLKYLDSKVGRDASAGKRLQSRLKNVLEGAGIGFAIDGVFAGVKALKAGGSKAVDGIKQQLRDAKLPKNVNSDISMAEPAGTM